MKVTRKIKIKLKGKGKKEERISGSMVVVDMDVVDMDGSTGGAAEMTSEGATFTEPNSIVVPSWPT